MPNSPVIQNPTAQQQANLKTASITAANKAAGGPVAPTPGSPVNSAPPGPAGSNQWNNPVYGNTAIAKATTPGQVTLTNPNTPGQPYIGPDASQANAQAQAQANPTPYFGGAVPQATNVGPNGTVVPAPQPVTQPQSIQQQANQQPGQQAQVAGALPQRVQIQSAQVNTQVAQQNNLATQPPQYQQPQVGGYPIQQTQPQLPPTGNLSTPQTVTDPSQQPAPQVDPNAQVQVFNNATGQMETVSPDDPRFGTGQLMQMPTTYQTGQSSPQQNIQQALDAHDQIGFSTLLQNAMQAGPNTSGAQMLQLNLQQQLGAVDDPTINQYLNNQISRTQQAYEMGMGYNSASSNELQEAIAGTLTNPQTVTGTQAELSKQMEGVNLQSIEAQQAWQTAQNQAQLSQLQTNRSDLEGYLKAQMALSAGSDTGPSTAALTVMSQSLHASDLNITLQNASNTYAQTQLSIQGSQTMINYTNNINQLGAQVNQQRLQTTSDYYTSLNQIDQNALANEQQKRQLTQTAYGNYSQQMADLNNNQLNRQVQFAQLGWQEINGVTQNAISMSGVTGYVMQPDGKGGYAPVTDANGNPVQTFDSNKNQFTQASTMASLGLQASSQQATNANSILNQAQQLGILPGDPSFAPFANSITQAMGLPQGALSSMSNYEQVSSYINTRGDTATGILNQVAANNNVAGVPQSVQQALGVGTVVKGPDGEPIQCGVFAGSLSTAPNVGNTWAQKLATVQKYGTIQSNPQPGYKVLVPLGVNTDGNEPGHVETVLSYDPGSGNMLTIDANRTAPGQVSLQVQNVAQLSQKYGSNWGFVPGALTPKAQQDLAGSGVSQIQTTTPPATDWNAVNQSLNSATSEGSSSIYSLYADKLASGQMSQSDLPSSMSLGLQNRVMSQALALNPNLNDTQNAFYKAWNAPPTSGTVSGNIASFNTAIKHLDVLYSVNKQMANSGITDANAAANYLKAHASDPAVAEYNAIMPGVADEVANAVTGGSPGVGDRQEAASAFDPNLGPAGFLKSIQGEMDLMGGKVNTLINSYYQKMGTYPTGTFDPEALNAFKDMGMDPSQYDPSLSDQSNTNGLSQITIPAGAGNYGQYTIPGTGGSQSNFSLGSAPAQTDSLGLGVGGDPMGLFAK